MRTQDAAFTEFVVARRPQLFRTAFLLCGDLHQAEDIVQVALTKLYRRWAKVEKMESVEAYARRVVVNAHVDDVRRASKREYPGLDNVPEPVAPAGTPVEDADELWAALRRLPAGQRRVVVLRHYWGLSVEETARDLGVSTGTVKSQTSDALRALRAALEPARIGEER